MESLSFLASHERVRRSRRYAINGRFARRIDSVKQHLTDRYYSANTIACYVGGIAHLLAGRGFVACRCIESTQKLCVARDGSSTDKSTTSATHYA